MELTEEQQQAKTQTLWEAERHLNDLAQIIEIKMLANELGKVIGSPDYFKNGKTIRAMAILIAQKASDIAASRFYQT
jgi:predicted RNA-binding protein YlqC (UPF0109 family)